MSELFSSAGECDVVASFKKQLANESWKRKAACGRTFYAASKITEWMKTKETNESSRNAGRLLLQIYGNNPRRTFPVSSESILDGEHQCPLVFAILLSLNLGELIHCFQRASWVDSKIPAANLEKEELRKSLARSGVSDPDQVIKRFERAQWSFCPVTLSSGMSGVYKGGDWILPFCKREKITEKGGTADLWQVLIQEDLLPEEFRGRIRGSAFEYKGLGLCYSLAVKSYRTMNRDDYEDEREAFFGLQQQQHEGMIQCFGGYAYEERQDNDLETTYNLLLEFGESDLEEFFGDAHCYPPVLTLEIIEFWRSLSIVAQTIKRVHNLEFKTKDGYRSMVNGWHADIKPANILRVAGNFKLADFGFARFQRQSQTVPMQFIDGGTEEYGPPELDCKRRRATRTPVSQAIDTWSFGCVLSFSATWVVLNRQGVAQFHNFRKQAIQKLRERKKNGEMISTPAADDAFHNGRDVLPEVLHWHNYLRSVMRQSDTVTGRILDLVDNRMLLSNPSDRIVSTDLCSELERILDEAEKHYSMHLQTGQIRDIEESVKEALLVFDKKAPSNAVEAAAANTEALKNDNVSEASNGTSVTSKRIGKSKLEIPRVKTASRAGVLERSLNDHRKLSVQTQNLQDGLTHRPHTIHASPTEIVMTEQPSQLHGQEFGESFRGLRDFSRTPNDGSGVLPRHEASSPSISLTPTRPLYPHQSAGYSFYSESELSPGTSGNSSSAPFLQQQRESWPAQQGYTGRFPPHNTDIVPSRVSPVGVQQPPTQAMYRRETFPPSTSAHVDEIKTEHDIYHVRQELEKNRPKGFAKFTASIGKSKKDADLEQDIQDRDIKFIVDNGWTMHNSWNAATYVLVTLAWKLSGLDDDGLDVVFTIGQKWNIENARGTNVLKKFEQAMQSARPIQSESSERKGKTDMSHTLGQAFDKYMKSHKRKRMTLVVLTDGIWEGSVEDDDVERKIASFIKTLNKNNSEFEERRFSIQFIRFGVDPRARARLEGLDDALCKNYRVPDIVDTVHYTGTVRKMLLGSFKAVEDRGEDENKARIDSAAAPDPMSPGSLASPLEYVQQGPYGHAGYLSGYGSYNNVQSGRHATPPTELPVSNCGLDRQTPERRMTRERA